MTASQYRATVPKYRAFCEKHAIPNNKKKLPYVWLVALKRNSKYSKKTNPNFETLYFRRIKFKNSDSGKKYSPRELTRNLNDAALFFSPESAVKAFRKEFSNKFIKVTK